MKFKYILFLLAFNYLNAQDSSKVITKKIIVPKKIEGIDFKNKTITSEILSDSTQTFLDNEIAEAFEEKWREELYNNSLFDTIYREVTGLKYEAVYYPELPTDTLKARLKRLQARTPFNVEYNEELESVIKNFLKNRQQSLERLMGLSTYYFPMFEREFDNLDIPLEMKYLAIVESALKPKAKSRVGATGLWQFMYPTGKQYGLDVTSYVDERSDPIKSTTTAGVYLSRLYDIFGDWDLALAAYNSGPGNVLKAIRRSGGYKNYWNLRPFLPRETAGYVPAFLATMYIFEYAEEHGFVKHRPKYRHIETDTIHIKRTISFDQISEVTGVDIEEIQYLNPTYKLDIIPFVKEKNYTLTLPKEIMAIFVANEEQIYAYVKEEEDKREKPLPQLTQSENKIRYRVRNGDYLGKIARKYGVRISQLKQWNGLRNNNINIGQRLTIYTRDVPKTQPVVATKTETKTTQNKSSELYTVKSGDSLWSISQKFPGVSVENIQKWNNISGTKLKLGMKLKVSKS